jgi:hypothetical protein
MNSVSTLGQTGNPGRADRTSTGKEHFEVLDGLRGSAAILIVIFHVFNYSFGWDTPLSLMHHAYLAVDFFLGYPALSSPTPTMTDGHECLPSNSFASGSSDFILWC